MLSHTLVTSLDAVRCLCGECGCPRIPRLLLLWHAFYDPAQVRIHREMTIELKA